MFNSIQFKFYSHFYKIFTLYICLDLQNVATALLYTLWLSLVVEDFFSRSYFLFI